MTRRFAVVSIPALILLIVMATGTVLIASPTPGSTEAIVTIDESKEPLKLALGYKAEVFYKTSHALRHVRNSNGIGNSAGSA